MPPIDASGLIPTSQSAELISAAVTQSAVLQLARRQPMPTGAASVPILAALPDAGFVGVGGRKPFSDMGFTNEVLKAEEVAATVAIPQAYLDDAGINLWNSVRPELGAAIGRAVDNAVLFGAGAPPSFPAGGIINGAPVIADATDAVETVNQAMAAVENSGLAVTGSAADMAVKSVLRGVRDTNNALLLGVDQVNGNQVNTLYGVPIAWNVLESATIDFVTGDWTKLILGIRQDMRYETSSEGVIVDGAGAVVISAFQDDVVLMRVYMRLGCVLAKPVGPRGQTVPFAVADLAPPVTGSTGLSVNASGGQSEAPASATASQGSERQGSERSESSTASESSTRRGSR